MVAPPLAFLVSLFAVLFKQNRALGIVGLIISGLCMVVFFGIPLVITLCR